MAWTIKVAVLCVVGSVIVANKEYESPLKVFWKPWDIKTLFKLGKTYYVAATTVRKGPLEFPRYYAYCGEVKVEKDGAPIIIKRRFLHYTKRGWNWLEAKYNVSIETDSTERKPRDYAAVRSMHGMKALVQTLYLLWLENNTCALLYNKHTGDCESWEFTKLPLKEIGQSDCSKLTLVCQKRSSIRYIEECYKHY
uniref:Putative salivary lipocalin n=1 Tax=Ixodes ricinus TaxID=34613 RepID=A0A147BX24_IXORI